MTTARVLSDNREPKRTPPRVRLLVIALVVVAVVVAGMWILKPTTPTTAPTSSPTPEPSTTSTADGTQYLKNATTQGEIIPGLWRGTATVTTGNSNLMYGIPIGWPQSVDGAVGQAVSANEARYSLSALVEPTSEELSNVLYSPDNPERVQRRETEGKEAMVKLRAEYNLDEYGVLLDSNGLPSVGEKFYGGNVRDYALYQVREVTPSEDAPTKVRIAICVPSYSGRGTSTDLSQVTLWIMVEEYEMVWNSERQDWQVWDYIVEGYWESRASNPGWQDLVSRLGPGWIAPADGTQDPIPGAVLTQ